MVDLVQQSEQHVAAYKEELRGKNEWMKALKQQLQAMQNPAVLSPVNHEAAAKVDRNGFAEIHSYHSAVLSTLQEKNEA